MKRLVTRAIVCVFIALCVSSGAFADTLAWDEGSSMTINFSNGVFLLQYMRTNLLYQAGDTISIISGSTPSGVILSAAGPCPSPYDGKLCSAFVGTPSVDGVSNVTLRASHSGQTADIAITFTSGALPPTLSGSVTSTAIVGGSYNSSLTASDGTAPYTYSILSGTLPPGLALTPSTGAVTGTPTTSGTYNFTMRVTDSAPLTADSSNQTITVYDALSVTTSSLAATTVGASYSQTLASVGGTTPKTWSIVSGILPTGLSLNPSTGAVTGAPSASGTANFTVQVACCGSGTAQKALSIDVNVAPSISTASLPDGSVGTAYSQTLAASGGTGSYSWSISAGALPTGLSLDPSTGAITGTPSAGGTANFTVQVTDSVSISDTQALSIQVQDGPSITTASLAAVTVGQSVSTSLASTGGTAPFTWSISSGALPAGITLDPSTGALTGTPTAAEGASFTAQVSDNNGLNDTQALTWTVNAAPSITTTSLAETTVGAAYSETVTATGGTGSLTWSTSGGWASGLTLNPSTGAITGTAVSAGTTFFTLRTTDANGVIDEESLSLTVNPAPSVTTASLAQAPVTIAYSQALASSGGTGAHTWSITAGALPTGLTLDPSTGAITGTPTAVGTTNFTVQAADSLGITGSRELSIEVVNGPTVTTTSLAAVTVGQSVSTTLAGTGGTAPLTWSISSGALPAGITLDPSTGALTGTPTTAETANFTARVVDSYTLEDSQALTWTVNAAPSMTTTSLAPTTVGAAYSQTVSGGGGTGSLAWSIATGALPSGLSLNPSAGAITGTATASGEASFTVRATDSNSVTAEQALSITVNPAPSVTTASLTLGVTAVAYSQTLASTGGTGGHTWSIAAGVLPTGLTLNPSTGAITGTPAATGTANFTVQVADSLGITGSQALSIEVVDHPDITTTSLASVTVGQTVSASVAVTNGTAPYTWSISSGALPAGITLNPSTGALTGTPTAAGPAPFTVKVADANSLEDTQALNWTVNAAPSITTSTLPATTVGAAYSQTVAATGGTGSLAWSLATGAFPFGLSLNPSTGDISGTPTAAGTANFTIRVTDANSVTVDQALSITINPAPSVTTASLPLGVTTVAYSQTLASTGGTGTITWSVTAGALPAGLTLNPANGAIMGAPTVTGTANFTVQVADARGITGSRALSIEVVD